MDESGCCVLALCAAGTDEDDDSCQDVECGPNAECKREVLRDSDTICVCKEGYSGDPDSDKGCSLSADLNKPENVPEGACVTQNSTYQPGQTWFDGCDYKCSCNNGEILCESRCKIVTENVDDSCELKPDPEDECCQIMVCSSVEGTSNASVRQPSLPSDGCQHKNASYAKDERWYDGCEQQCQCMGFGDVFCLPRCQPIQPELGEDCYTLPDVTDSCCNVTVCDKPKNDVPDVVKISRPASVSEKQPRMNDLPSEGEVFIGNLAQMHHGVEGKVYAHNESTIIVKDASYDGEGVDVFFWATTQDTPDGEGVILPYPFEGKFYEADDKDAPVLPKLEKQTVVLTLPSKLKISDLKWISVFSKQFSIVYGSVQLPDKDDLQFELLKPTSLPQVQDIQGCKVGEKVYKYGEEFYKDCESYCICTSEGEFCNDIECPSEFGLDVINPNCIEWDKHEDFIPTSPNCCPPLPVCISDGSCQYKGQNFTNYDSIPEELTGCEQRCHCEDGEVQCRDACYEIPANPPSWLPCDTKYAVQIPNPDRVCCKIWGCDEPAFEVPRKLIGAEVVPHNDTCLKIVFEIPPSITDKAGWYSVAFSHLSGHPDPSRWPTQKTEVEGGIIPDITQGKAYLCSLAPNTQYLLRPSIILKDYENEPIEGDILQGMIKFVDTRPVLPQPRVLYVDMKLEAQQVTTNSARIIWKHLDEKEEKPYVDGVQLRVLTLKGDIPVSHVPETSPFIHRDTNYYVFENLTPNTKYEVDLDMIPVPGSLVELYSGLKLTFTTEEFIDPFDFTPILSVINISSNAVEVGWTGVPSPDQKFVNIYRVIYHSLNTVIEREESSVFKISKIDSPKRLLVTGLDQDLDYQIWLESYLTNGKIVKSNVEEFRTLKSTYPASALPSSEDQPKADYYQSMVAASVIAAIALLVLVIILYFYLKRFTTYKATITKDPPTPPKNGNGVATAYDNPAFKGFENDRNSNINQTFPPPGPSFELGPLNSEI